jgi:hypothetical protein
MNIEKLSIAFVGIDGFIHHLIFFCVAEESLSLQPQMLASKVGFAGCVSFALAKACSFSQVICSMSDPLHHLSHIVPFHDMMKRNNIIVGYGLLLF